jgi:hypothetical protein
MRKLGRKYNIFFGSDVHFSSYIYQQNDFNSYNCGDGQCRNLELRAYEILGGRRKTGITCTLSK